MDPLADGCGMNEIIIPQMRLFDWKLTGGARDEVVDIATVAGSSSYRIV